MALAVVKPQEQSVTAAAVSRRVYPESIAVDPEFSQLCSPLTSEERAQLESNILADGIREPLVVWERDGELVLVDGHNRLGICKSHDLELRVVHKAFESREQAHDWIIDNQLGRRNITPATAAYLRGKQYRAMKQRNGGDRKSVGKSCQVIQTSTQLAEKHGVSEKTIRNDADYSANVDAIGEVDPEFKAEILSGETRVRRKEAAAAAEAAAGGGDPRTAAGEARAKSYSVPHKSHQQQNPNSERRKRKDELDEQIRTAIADGAESVQEVARSVGCHTSRVYQTKTRLGLNAEKNPLEGLTQMAEEYADAWAMALERPVLWAEAKPEQALELTQKLKDLVTVTRKLIRRLNNDAVQKGDAE